MAVAKLAARPAVSKTSSQAIAAKKPAAPKNTARVNVAAGVINATINGKKITIKDSHISPLTQAFILDGGKSIAFNGSGGAGGFEGEGQSLSVYDVKSGKSKVVLSGYYMIDTVKSLKTPDGKSALIVGQSDGGLGANHMSIVDPTRGEVYQAPQFAKFVSEKNGLLKMALYNEESYSDGGNPRPTGYKSISLADALKGPVIVNRNYMLEMEEAAVTK